VINTNVEVYFCHKPCVHLSPNIIPNMLRSLVFTLTIFIILYSGNLIAKTALQFGPAPAWVISVNGNTETPNAREINDGYFLRLFEQEYNVTTQQTYQHTIREIISEAGIQSAANLSLNYNPSYEQITIHKVVVWRAGKPIDRLNKDAFKIVANEEDLSRFIYNGNYTAYMILDDIRVGDKIEYSYTLTGNNPIFENKFFTSLVLQGSDPIPQMHYCIITPENRKLNFKYFNDAKAPDIQNKGGNVIYEWNLQNLKGLEVSSNTPSWYIAYPYIQISEYNNWTEIAQWAHSINKPNDRLTGALDTRIKNIAGKYKDNKPGLLRAITEMVQTEIRYMGVEIGPYSHKANNPEKVYEQRYGDCKDKSLLLVSALLSVGIPAEMALVNTNSLQYITNRIPSPTAFNHAIVVAHINDKEVWIDPTMSYQGSNGADFYCPYYGTALVLGAGKTELTPIPESNNGIINYTEL
jgi:transglutaminase-like putative cysteine protease